MLQPNGSVPWANGNPCYAWTDTSSGTVYFTPVVNVVSTGTVYIESPGGPIDVAISGTPSVIVGGGSVDVTIAGTPNVVVSSGAIDIANTPSVTVASGVIDIGTAPDITIAGTVDASISSGTVDIGSVGSVVVTETTAPQEVLATCSGSSQSQSVTLPSNAESILVLIPSATYTGVVTVTGNTTGIKYPVGSVSALTGSEVYEVAAVIQALDTAVTIGLSVAPAETWYIVSDSVLRYTFGASSSGSPLASGISIGAPIVIVPIVTEGASYSVAVTVRGNGSTGLLAIFDSSGNAAASTPSLTGSTWTLVEAGGYTALWICSDLPSGVFTISIACTSGTVQGAALAIISGASLTAPVESSTIASATNVSETATLGTVTPAVIGDIVVGCFNSQNSRNVYAANTTAPPGGWMALSIPNNVYLTSGALFSILPGVEGVGYTPVLTNTQSNLTWTGIQAVLT